MQPKASYLYILGIAAPVIFTALVQNLVGLTDRLFLGNYSTEALGAHGLAFIWFFILWVALMGLSSGVQIMVARRMGENRPKLVGRLVDQTILLGTVLSLLAFVLVYWGTDLVLKYFVQNTAILNEMQAYLSGRSWEYLTLGVFMALRGYFMGIGKTSIFVATGILQGLLNVAGNYALIFGNWGCPELGMWGAGLASMISAQIALMVMVGYALYQGLHRRHQFFRSLQPEWARIRALLNISTPMMIQGAASLSAYFLFFTVIEGFGLQAIAVSNILHGVYVLMMTATWGFNVATSTGVSTALGAGNEAIARRVVLRAGLLSLATTLVVCGLVWLSPIWLFGLFSKDQALIEQAVLLSGVILWPILIYALSGVLFGAVSGTGATRAGLIIEVLMIVVYMVYMFGFVAPTGSLRLAWSAEWLYMFVMGLLSVLYLASGHWRRIKV